MVKCVIHVPILPPPFVHQMCGYSGVKLQLSRPQELQQLDYRKQVGGWVGGRGLQATHRRGVSRIEGHAALMNPDARALNPPLCPHCNPQGDAEMYTEEAIQRRLQLRSDPLVIAAVKMWWG